MVKIIKKALFILFLHFYGRKVEDPMNAKRNSEADIQPSQTKKFTNKGLFIRPKTN